MRPTKDWYTARYVPSGEGRSVTVGVKLSLAKGTLPITCLSLLMELSAVVERLKTAPAASRPSIFPESYLGGPISNTSSPLKQQPMHWCFISNAALCSPLPPTTVEFQVFCWPPQRTSFDVHRSTRC